LQAENSKSLKGLRPILEGEDAAESLGHSAREVGCANGHQQPTLEGLLKEGESRGDLPTTAPHHHRGLGWEGFLASMLQ
jgi:hypothetical protein